MNRNTTWERASSWYEKIVRKQGHYYHREVIFPKLLSYADFPKAPGESLLDVACGEGVLARQISPKIEYRGIDGAPSLIKQAKQQCTAKHHRFCVGDIRKPFPFKKRDFTHATCVLALQNVDDPLPVLSHIHSHLAPQGKLFLVVNHPCFRIPRQSHWGVDEKSKVQYRRVDRYLTPLEIPIRVHPSQKKDSVTVYSYHYSLSFLSKLLKNTGFFIQEIEEWTSGKKSMGRCAKMENRARSEFPLFLSVVAQKVCPSQNQD